MALQHSAPVRPMWSLSVFLNSSAVASTRHEACDMKSSLKRKLPNEKLRRKPCRRFFPASPRLIWFSARMIMISRWICWLHCFDMSPSFSVQFLPQKYSFCFAVERSLLLTTKVVFPLAFSRWMRKKGSTEFTCEWLMRRNDEKIHRQWPPDPTQIPKMSDRNNIINSPYFTQKSFFFGRRGEKV